MSEARPKPAMRGMKFMKVFFPSGLPGRTILLILFWEAFVFSFPLVSSIAVPSPFVALLATSAVLVGMHQAFHWDIPFGRTGWYKLGGSTRAIRLIYGPVVVVGWFLDKLFTGLSLSVAAIGVFPFVVPGILCGFWREYRILRNLSAKGRRLDWNQALHLLEQGKGFLLLEYVAEEAGASWEDLSRLWWIPRTESPDPAELGLPTYRQLLANMISWEMAHQSLQLGYQEYQHLEHGREPACVHPRILLIPSTRAWPEQGTRVE
jgi:hypothetical protein